MAASQPNNFNIAQELHHQTTVVPQQIREAEQELIRNCFKELNQPDSKGYLGTTEREYKKEFARHHTNYGKDAISDQTDMMISAKLLVAGHQPEDISQTLKQHSPNVARKIAADGGRNYGNVTTQNAHAVVKNSRNMSAYSQKIYNRVQKNQPADKVDRRLSSYGLDKKIAPKKAPTPPSKPNQTKSRKR